MHYKVCIIYITEVTSNVAPNIHALQLVQLVHNALQLVHNALQPVHNLYTMHYNLYTTCTQLVHNLYTTDTTYYTQTIHNDKSA